MNSDKVFETKTGFCHILPESIVITRSNFVAETVNGSGSGKMTRVLFIYIGLAAFFTMAALYNFSRERTTHGILQITMAVFLIYTVITNRNMSVAPVILRNRIKAVKFIKGIPFLTRSRFEIVFEDDAGEMRKRFIILPGSLSGGKEETEKAVRIMRKENLLK
ncbi:MAG: phosphoribosylaminoimidazolesuccinocarboxamide synthase [Bacteroidetes bacterium]|nr:phosphoribosylaminoimidazolesuccinocarboxamide synthase [Bacteroidota bacterium]